MAAPGLDRLFTRGFYGTAANRFLSVTTHGWYDEPDNIKTVTLESASVVQPGITASVTQPSVTASVAQPSITVDLKNDIS